MTTVHASANYEISANTPAPEDYPSKFVQDDYSSQPFNKSYDGRRQAFLQHCLNNPAPQNTKAAYVELARLAAGGTPHEGVINAALDYIDQRKDCADFVLHSILRLIYQFGDHPLLSVDLLNRARKTVLGFKYWPDEPGIDSMCTWTENHQILFTSGAYLAGQLYPRDNFSNSGHSGIQKMEINRRRIFRWLELRFRTGFSEWLSHVYYDEDLTALLSLVEFCQDAEIRQRATMVIDLILLDMALNSFKGTFGSSHGRSYENTKKWASNEATTDTSKLLFGSGVFSSFDNMSAVAFALSTHYRLPPVIYAIANDHQQPEVVNQQRMGIRLDEAASWGLGFEDFEDGMIYLSLEAYAHPRTANLVLDMFDSYNWWENSFFKPFKSYKNLLQLLRRTRLLGTMVRLFEWDVCRNTREEVNIYTYRTPDYMLSTAQDYRAGYGGDQQHIWQATLGENAVCFTTHPAKRAGPSPNYWAGSGVLPRAAQVKNVAIVVYKISTRPALYVPSRMFFTHAWLPKDQYDDVIERDGWIFARRRNGYLALRSMKPYHWQDEPGEDQDKEIIAPGKENIWLCELGRRDTDGQFDEFIERICASRLEFNDLNVIFQSPSQGQLEFGWKGPLRQDGLEVPLNDYPRYQNPYTRTEFSSSLCAISCAGKQLKLTFDSCERFIVE